MLSASRLVPLIHISARLVERSTINTTCVHAFALNSVPAAPPVAYPVVPSCTKKVSLRSVAFDISAHPCCTLMLASVPIGKGVLLWAADPFIQRETAKELPATSKLVELETAMQSLIP